MTARRGSGQSREACTEAGSHAGRLAAGAAVLLNVESDAVERTLRSRAFRAAGYQVIEAGTAGGALIAAARDAPSVALIDVSMCDTGTVALCETLKHLRPGVVVVLIASGEIEPRRDKDLAAVADAYVGHSIEQNALVECVGDAVARDARDRAARPWVISDEAGFILEASPDAARLLHHAVRTLHGKSLLMFFEQDRESWRASLTRAASGEPVRQSGSLRPKERRPIHVWVDVQRCTEWNGPAFRWSFTITPPARADDGPATRTASARRRAIAGP